MRNKILAIILILALAVFGGIWYFQSLNQAPNSTPVSVTNVEILKQASSVVVTSSIPQDPAAATSSDLLAWPLSSAPTRITKKPFGLKVSPTNSSVKPERFSGYHTGVDFETWPSEQTSTVSVQAICAGPLLMKKWATGYGGVAVQKCEFKKQIVTIIYGHLNLASIKASVGDKIIVGQEIGVLGKGYSPETDGERKHLHLGIHSGSSIYILGYVPKQSQLVGWLDAAKYLVK